MFSVFPDFNLQLNLGFNAKVRISCLLNIAYTIILNLSRDSKNWKIYEIKAKSKIYPQGRLERREAVLIPALMVNKHPVGLKYTKWIQEFFDWVGYKTQSLV